MSTPAAKEKQPPWIWVGLVFLVVLALLVALVLSGGGGDDDDDPAEGLEQVQPVEVTGDALPGFVESAGDPAVGVMAPELRGVSFDGDLVEVTRDGRGKLLVFLAHWCPHCQAEVPRIVEHLADGNELPDNVDLVAVSTAVDENQPNFPPSTWLESEGWTNPVLVDNGDDAAATAFGLSGFPYLVALDPDGNVVGRVAGEFGMDVLDALAELAAG